MMQVPLNHWNNPKCTGLASFLQHNLFPLGIMNIAAMAGLTLVIFAEKMFPRWERIAQGVGLALILSGILVIVVPATLSRSLALM